MTIQLYNFNQALINADAALFLQRSKIAQNKCDLYRQKNAMFNFVLMILSIKTFTYKALNKRWNACDM